MKDQWRSKCKPLLVVSGDIDREHVFSILARGLDLFDDC